MNGQDLLKRRLEDRCIRCGSKEVALDPETGFVARLCVACERDLTDELVNQRGGGVMASGREWSLAA